LGNLEDQITDAKFLERLRVLNPARQKAKLERFYSDLPTNNFDWVFELQKYADWETGKGAQVLWVEDGTGAGYTILTLKVLHRLISPSHGSQLETSGPHSVAYSFCGDGCRYRWEDSEEDRGKGDEQILASWILQDLLYSLLSQDPKLLSAMRTKNAGVVNQLGTRSYSLTQKLLRDALEEQTSKSHMVYLVIDCRHPEIQKAHEALGLIVSQFSQFPGIRWMISSDSTPSRLWTSTATSKLVLSCVDIVEAFGLGEVNTLIRHFGEVLDQFTKVFGSHQRLARKTCHGSSTQL